MSWDQYTDTCQVKFVDYGGYSSVPVGDLRQIRSDFMNLPFLAVEVLLLTSMRIFPLRRSMGRSA